MKRQGLSILSLLLFAVAILAAGCAGGGSGPAVTAPVSVGVGIKIAPPEPGRAPYEPIPSTARGAVTVVLIDRANKTLPSVDVADYQAGSITIEREFNIHGTYEVIVLTALRYRPNDTYEVIFAGTSEVFIHSNEEVASHSGYNQVFVTLVFSQIRETPLVPTLEFYPDPPLQTVAAGSQVPSFSVRIIDQFGNLMTSESGPVAVELAGGSLSGQVSANASGGVASFQGLSVASVPRLNQTFFRVSYKALNGLSKPVSVQASSEPAANSPNATVAGYLNYEIPNFKASPVNRVVAAAVGKKVTLVAGGAAITATTDMNGFFKIDAFLASPYSDVEMKAEDSNGSVGGTKVRLVPGKLHIARGVMRSYNDAELYLADGGAFGGVLPAESLKLQVDQKIAALRSSSGGATGMTGTTYLVNASTGAFEGPVSGAAISVSPGGNGTFSDDAGLFRIDGVFPAGTYRVSASKQGYSSSYKDVTITSNEYGFTAGGFNFTLHVPQQPVKTLSSLSITPSEATTEVGTLYFLSSANISAIAGYSDGTTGGVVPVWKLISGSGAFTESNLSYQAGSAPETAIFEASYASGGVTRTAAFKLNVAARPKSLVSLSMLKNSDTMEVGSTYAFFTMKVFANYSDGSSREIAAEWSLLSGSGQFGPEAYKAPLSPETASFRAVFTENGVTRSLDFSLNVIPAIRKLVSVLAFPAQATVEVSTQFDLNKVRVIGFYSDNSTSEIQSTWQISAGGGGIGTGNMFVVPSNPGETALGVFFNDESGNYVSRPSILKIAYVLRPSFTIMRAEYISDNAIKVVFSTPVRISGFVPSAVSVDGAPLGAGSKAVLDQKNDPNLQTLIINSASFFQPAAVSGGSKGGVTGKGFEVTGPCGIVENVSGAVLSVTTVGVDILRDVTPPPGPGPMLQAKMISFSNAFGRVSASDSFNYPEPSKLEFGVGVTTSASNGVTALAAENAVAAGHNIGDVIITAVAKQTPSQPVFYRFIDGAGNASEWIFAGIVPDRPAPESISWHNNSRSFRVSGSQVAKAGERMLVYQYGAAGRVFKAAASAVGPYVPESFNFVGTAINDGLTVSYTLQNPGNIESDFTDDGVVPPAPPAAAMDLRIAYFPPDGGYRIKNMNQTAAYSVPAEYDLGVLIGSFNAGRLTSGSTLASGSTSAVTFNSIADGGTLSFVNIDKISSNVSTAVGSSFVPPAPVLDPQITIPGSENGSDNGPNSITAALAATITTAVANGDMSRLRFSVAKCSPGKLDLVLINRQAGLNAILTADVPSAISAPAFIEFTLQPGTGNYSTLAQALGTPNNQNLEAHLKVASDGNNSKEMADNRVLYGTGGTAPVLPVATGAKYVDTNNDGEVDQLVVTFSKVIGTRTVTGVNFSWSNAGTPFAGITLSSANAGGTGNTVTLPFDRQSASTGSSVQTTLSYDGLGTLADDTGNRVSAFSALPVADAAPPYVQAIDLINGVGAAAGKLDTGDVIMVYYSEPMKWDNLVAGLSSAAMANTVIPINFDKVPRIGNFGVPADFGASATNLSTENSGMTLRVMPAGTITPGTKAVSGAFTPAPDMADAAGNPVNVSIKPNIGVNSW